MPEMQEAPHVLRKMKFSKYGGITFDAIFNELYVIFIITIS